MTTFDLTTEIVLDVTTTEDQNDGSDKDGLSLRDAILIASTNSEKKYIINLPAGFYALTLQNILQPPTIDENSVDFATLVESRNTTGDLDIFGNITIIGEDPENTIISAEGLKREFRGFQIIDDDIDVGGVITPSITNIYTVGDRVFDVASGAILTLENVTIQDGLLIESDIVAVFSQAANQYVSLNIGNIDTTPNGAAINVDAGANVVINNSIIADSRSEEKGGGINNSGTLELNDTIVRNNKAEDVNLGLVTDFIADEDGEDGTFVIIPKQAGGIYNTGTITINRSAIIDNFVESATPENLEGAGAGIYNESGAILNVINTTISGNNGGLDAGGGILNRGSATILGSTIVNNTAQVGGGIYAETTGASTTLNNTIVASNNIQAEITQTLTADFARFFADNFINLLPSLGYANDFVWDSIDASLNDELTDYYIPRVYLENGDPFSGFPPEGLDVTSSINLDNLIFNFDTGEIEFLFNSFVGLEENNDNFFSSANGFDGEDNNLLDNSDLGNGDRRFAFAYSENSGNLVYLDTEFSFDADGKVQLTLIDSSLNANVNFNQDIFLADRLQEFQISSDNKVILDDENKTQAPFARDQNNQVLNSDDVTIFENRIIEEFTQTITDLPPRTDIDGFFNPSSANNLIGSSSTNNILNGVNNNLVGSTVNPLDPVLGPLADNGGSTPTHALLDGSPALNTGNNNIVERFDSVFENVDQRGENRIEDGTVDIGAFELQDSDIQQFSSSSESLLDAPLYRFQNSNQLGTYLFALEEESNTIRANYPNFIEEGIAFNVGLSPNDDLIAMYRFQNINQSGTYLYVGEEERQNVLANYADTFQEEGLAFYVYGADADKGTDIFRLQNLDNPGTYIFVTEPEKDSILANFTNFRLEGVAFEV